MAALVMLVLLVCACSLFCELFQRRLEEVVPLAACAIVLLIYAFALAGLLRAGALAALGTQDAKAECQQLAFAANRLLESARERERTAREHRRLLRTAGFALGAGAALLFL